MTLAAETPMTRRIVLEHATGTLAGVCQILGTEASLTALFNPESLPKTVILRMGGEPVTCIFVRNTDRSVVYRELPLNPHLIYDKTPTEGIQ